MITMIEYIQITFTNGEIFLIPALVVGREYAKYHRKRDASYSEQDYLEEILRDCFDLCDWLKNNMDWKDVELVAKKLEIKPFNYHKGLGDADTRCVWSD